MIVKDRFGTPLAQGNIVVQLMGRGCQLRVVIGEFDENTVLVNDFVNSHTFESRPGYTSKIMNKNIIKYMDGTL